MSRIRPSPAQSAVSLDADARLQSTSSFVSQPASSSTHLMPPPANAPSPFGKNRNSIISLSRLGQKLSPHAAFLKRSSFFAPTNGPYLSSANHGGPYLSTSARSEPSLSDKFALSPDPAKWGTVTSMGQEEPDDFIHNPDPKRDRLNDRGSHIFTSRGLANIGCLLLLGVGLVALFAGYPLITYFTSPKPSTLGGFNLGGINASGQVPVIASHYFSMIDPDTPQSAWTKPSLEDGSEMTLVFSDEFNVEGRTFYEGDDPYWEAVDLHYWQTNNLEWYDPVAITTAGGALKITLSKLRNHDLDYQGGLLSSWNKFCFTGGYIEVNVSLPGQSDVFGLWPAVWTMGNLGRAGYGASLEGLWPYTYDACDVGTLANQTHNGLPLNATVNGDPDHDGALSYLSGQRLSACTCSNDKTHPGPKKSDGSWTGRGAPEIDVFEAQVDDKSLTGFVSQSAQWAPFNYEYDWFNTSANLQIPDPTTTKLNPYTGGVLQQASSGLSKTNQKCYTQSGGCYSLYGFEYQRGYQGYITWVSDGKPVWTARGAGFAADPRVEISARPIPMEPMYIIMNLGISPNFGPISPDIVYPVSMLIDYVRVYQPTNARNVGCDPSDYPTAEYIARYPEAYSNYNLTTWAQYGQTNPKNKLTDTC
ncbi:glycoside hydrolase family 16 protein [Botryobasidium botryosum FD-172 SS1]|uniref:Glycoside hydrolase family 16 protein n=1 Tax=Botryobasidium botryosum (strain FD-172 SS1) TaxID=930990 RepID=A0A067NAI8_BOTB1|nr:glycoside hydrolase family 16 protein [Botryobasidium botryosum FD-172 SS1]